METPKRPRGRPRLADDDPTTSITVRMPTKEFDAADTRAKVERLTFPEWVRQTLRRASFSNEK